MPWNRIAIASFAVTFAGFVVVLAYLVVTMPPRPEWPYIASEPQSTVAMQLGNARPNTTWAF
jgi:hypothetical protein